MNGKKASPEGKTLVFSYGSNMNPKQIGERCLAPVFLAAARLPGYKIAFFGYAKAWDGAQESAIPEAGHDLWGAVYELSFSDREALDDAQDVRIDGTGPYFHYPEEVFDSKGVSYKVLLYKKDLQGEPRKPSQEHLAFIVEGALARGLPPSYVDELRQIEAVKASFPVPVAKRKLSLGVCDCGDLRESMGGPGLKPKGDAKDDDLL